MAKKIGIIGGMGPAAGCDLYEKILKLTPAKCDQEHIHVVLDSNTNIPDRTDYIMDVEKQKILDGKGPTTGGSPIIANLLEQHEINNPPAKDFLPEIIKSAQMLESIGCDAVAMPCVTAHYFENEIADSINIKFISITKSVVDALIEKHVKTSAILCTNGSLCGKIFVKAFDDAGIRPVFTNLEEQKTVMDLIYKYVKFGNYNEIEKDRKNVENMLSHLKDLGAQAFVLGCTETPIAFKLLGISGDEFIDSTFELARQTVKFAMGE